MADVNLNEPVNQAQANTAKLGNIFSQQRGETSDYLGRYNQTINSQPKTATLAADIGNQLGVPQLQQNAQMLRDTITNLPQTYGKATRGFDVNANQLQRIIAQKAGELAPAMETAERAYSSAQDNLNTRLGYEFRDQDRALLPYEKEGQFLGERLARETTGYTNAMQSELDAIIAKMNAGITLSEGEKNRANQLAMQEREYENQKKLYAEQARYSGGGNDTWQTIGDGAWLYNTQTGQVIQNPQDFKAGGGGGVYNPGNIP